MKINSIVNRYIFKEFIPPYIINLFFLTSIFLMSKILEVADLIVNYKASMISVGLIFFYSIPFFLGHTIPMAVMLTVLVTFNKMASDNEIVALKAGGVSIYSLLPPVLLFCFLNFFLTGFIAIYAVPWGQSSFKNVIKEVATTSLDYGLKERVFNDKFENVVLYINEIDIKKKVLRDVFIEDQRSESNVTTIFAPMGKLISNPDENIFALKLFKGSINIVDINTRSVHSIPHFDSTIIKIDLKKQKYQSKLSSDEKDEYSLSKLKQEIEKYKDKKDRKYYSLQMKYYEKFSIPVGCIVVGILAISLGLQSISNRKSSGMGVGLLFFVLYFLLMTVGWSMGTSMTISPVIAIWMANFIIGIIALYSLKRVAEEKPVEFGFLYSFLKEKLLFFSKKMKNIKH